jgi:hypothetical protein
VAAPTAPINLIVTAGIGLLVDAAEVILATIRIEIDQDCNARVGPNFSPPRCDAVAAQPRQGFYVPK